MASPLITLAWVVLFAVVSSYALHRHARGERRVVLLSIWIPLMLAVIALSVSQL